PKTSKTSDSQPFVGFLELRCSRNRPHIVSRCRHSSCQRFVLSLTFVLRFVLPQTSVDIRREEGPYNLHLVN
ncbi:hypothetical protein LINGRAHAP2_LOCUS13134, partial [Linum grandiflorum]